MSIDFEKEKLMPIKLGKTNDEIMAEEEQLRRKMEAITKTMQCIKSNEINPDALPFILCLLQSELSKVVESLKEIEAIKDMMEEDARKEEDKRQLRELENDLWKQMGENR